jgi:hypothetical protein
MVPQHMVAGENDDANACLVAKKDELAMVCTKHLMFPVTRRKMGEVISGARRELQSEVEV